MFLSSHLVEVRFARLPVVIEPGGGEGLSRLERLVSKRPGSDGSLRKIRACVAVLEDAGIAGAEDVGKEDERAFQRKLHGAVVHRYDIFGLQQRLELRIERGPALGIHRGSQRPHDVPRGHRRAVVELDALLQPDSPRLGAVAGFKTLRELGMGLKIVV